MRILSSFLGFVLAIAITVFIFAPDRLPVGYGFEPVPVELMVENSLAGQVVETVTGKSGKELVITNTNEKPIFNLTVTLRDGEGRIKHQHVSPMMPAAKKLKLGWAQNWMINPGDELEVAASAHYSVIWAL